MEPGTEVDTRKRFDVADPRNKPDRKRFDLEPVGMTYEEYLLRRARRMEDEKWMELFREGIRKQSGDAEEFFLNGTLVATCYIDGKFKQREFEEANPHIVEHYTDYVTEKKFNVERFKEENPEIYEQYRATSFRIK